MSVHWNIKLNVHKTQCPYIGLHDSISTPIWPHNWVCYSLLIEEFCSFIFILTELFYVTTCPAMNHKKVMFSVEEWSNFCFVVLVQFEASCGRKDGQDFATTNRYSITNLAHLLQEKLVSLEQTLSIWLGTQVSNVSIWLPPSLSPVLGVFWQENLKIYSF